MRRRLACAAALLIAAPGCASAGGRTRARARPPAPIVLTPEDAEPSTSSGDEELSQGGERRGGLEYGLGGTTAAVSAALIVFGAVQLDRAVKLTTFCEGSPQSTECDALIGNPPVNYYVSGGLSLGFSTLIAVASGFLFRRAVRTQRAYRAWHSEQVSITPWMKMSRGTQASRAGGLSLELRF